MGLVNLVACDALDVSGYLHFLSWYLGEKGCLPIGAYVWDGDRAGGFFLGRCETQPALGGNSVNGCRMRAGRVCVVWSGFSCRMYIDAVALGYEYPLVHCVTS